ncbi:hypothetical protein SCLCIDRAFT_143027 [Scleroderma citrinum Foug A]|uniref:Tetraspanin n=1 Tax=Scleroderma citrinum Foug A TaxID=1036808 RepID=A0A0C2YP94_9AGAM|nr:hypothetical protein SCLCIDRAFT_143027 [Scleroderma citrinum Foug A]
MLSKHLLVAWAFFDLCLMGAGILSLVLSFVWQEDNLLRNLTYSTFDLNIGRILGIVLLATSLLSVFLIILRGKRPLVIVNWLLLLDAVAILSVATFIWMYTLHERINYHAVFGRQSNATKIKVQDVLQCCGYFNATDEVAFGGNFCPDQAAAIVANSFCVTPIVAFADSVLNNVFSTVYGFMAIVIGLFLSTMCIMKKRQEAERFERIDAKQGGRGLV